MDRNPFFKDIAWQPSKGEVLNLKMDFPFPEKIFNAGKWLLPTDDGVKAGSTFTWDNIDSIPTLQGKKDIEAELGKFLKPAYKISGHLAGVRPAVMDLNPVLGPHPKFPACVIFNGFGAKGVLLAPFYAQKLVEQLLDKTALDRSVNVERLFS